MKCVVVYSIALLFRHSMNVYHLVPVHSPASQLSFLAFFASSTRTTRGIELKNRGQMTSYSSCFPLRQ